MPCESDYMGPTSREKEAGRVLMLINEIDDGEKIDPNKYVNACLYGASQKQLDTLTANLCQSLQKLDDGEVNEYSLELQMWWRDHQVADKRRLEREIAEKKKEKDRQKALSKLTDYEKKLLGIK